MPRVLNQRDCGLVEGAVYVGRPSPYGNPYIIGIHCKTRAQALALYEKYLLNSPLLLARVKRDLRGKDLFCWCAPKPCHADILLRYANA